MTWSDTVIGLYYFISILRQNKKRLVSFLMSILVILSSTVPSSVVAGSFSDAETPQDITAFTVNALDVSEENEERDSVYPFESDSCSRANADEFNILSDFKDSGLPISEIDAPSNLLLDENSIPTDYQYCVQAKATAYTGDTGTASGRTPMPGHIAVDPKEYPYGTELYVVSADGDYIYGYCIAADTGGFVKMGNTDIDLYLDNVDMCKDWGNRDVIIYVL